MKVINIHKRKINQSKETIYKLFETLSTKDDKIWPYEKWPAMRFKDGLKVGSHGGHGPIRYYVASITNNESMVFNFTTEGFNGSHSLNIKELNASEVEVSHIINLEVFGSAKWSWIFVIRWLHDALIEDLPKPKPRQRRHRPNTGRSGGNKQGGNRGNSNYRGRR